MTTMTNKSQRGKLLYIRRYHRTHILRRPEILVLFGDNLVGKGSGLYAGQAAECRGLFNCLGIPTKHNPTTFEGAWFSNEDFPVAAPLLFQQFTLAAAALYSGRHIAYPYFGIGTGRAGLKEKAPTIFTALETLKEGLEETASEILYLNNLGDFKD